MQPCLLQYISFIAPAQDNVHANEKQGLLVCGCEAVGATGRTQGCQHNYENDIGIRYTNFMRPTQQSARAFCPTKSHSNGGSGRVQRLSGVLCRWEVSSLLK
jgi:hypothetical protein